MLNVTDRQKLHRYAAGVTAPAKHHAANVDAVFHALLGFVSTYADKITLRGDGTVNVAWFTIGNNNRYAFSPTGTPREPASSAAKAAYADANYMLHGRPAEHRNQAGVQPPRACAEHQPGNKK